MCVSLCDSFFMFVMYPNKKPNSNLTGNQCFSVVLTIGHWSKFWRTSAFSALSQSFSHRDTLHKMTQNCYGVCVIIFENSHMSTMTLWLASGTVKIKHLSLTFSHSVSIICVLILHYSPHIQVLMLLKHKHTGFVLEAAYLGSILRHLWYFQNKYFTKKCNY